MLRSMPDKDSSVSSPHQLQHCDQQQACKQCVHAAICIVSTPYNSHVLDSSDTGWHSTCMDQCSALSEKNVNGQHDNGRRSEEVRAVLCSSCSGSTLTVATGTHWPTNQSSQQVMGRTLVPADMSPGELFWQQERWHVEES